MTAYIYSPEVHAQIVASLEATCGGRCNAEYNPCWEYELADRLKAMKPVEPCAFMLTTTNYGLDAEQWDTTEYRMDKWDEDCSPLYAKEQQ